MVTHTKKDICEITGLKPRQIQFLTEEGIITPNLDSGVGRGKTRRYSDRALIDFSIAKELLSFGITKEVIRKILTNTGDIRYLNPYLLEKHKFVLLVFRQGNEFIVKLTTQEEGKILPDADIFLSFKKKEESEYLRSNLILSINLKNILMKIVKHIDIVPFQEHPE